MNIQSKRPDNFPVEVPLVKKIMIRLMSRNEADHGKAFTLRQTLAKNFESLNMAPEAHLGLMMEGMQTAAINGREATFEMGLLFGVALTLSSRSVNGKGMLKAMLRDIEKQQDGNLTQAEKDAQFKQLMDAVPDEVLQDEGNGETNERNNLLTSDSRSLPVGSGDVLRSSERSE